MTGITKNRVATDVKKKDHYLELVQKFPLKRLRSDHDLAAAIRMVKSLLIRGDLAAGEQDYLDVLTDIVERYERDAHPMPRVTDAHMLRHLIDARGITQAKLASEVGIPMSTISEVLRGKRKLNRTHISTFAKYFGVNPGAFLP